MAGFALRFFSPFVNAYTKVAQAVIRLIAFVCVVASFFLYGDDFYIFVSQQSLPGRGWLILLAIPFLIGLILFWKCRALAARLTKGLD